MFIYDHMVSTDGLQRHLDLANNTEIRKAQEHGISKCPHSCAHHARVAFHGRIELKITHWREIQPDISPSQVAAIETLKSNPVPSPRADAAARFDVPHERGVLNDLFDDQFLK